MRDFEFPGRSPVHSRHGMAATSHPLATLAALDVLRSGGNAMDAAVAACAVQCVVEPQSTGIGGDCFMLYAPGGAERIVAFNGSGRAPAASDAARLRADGLGAIARQSADAVTIPGAIDAWAQLVEAHGTKSLGELLQPAIAYAEDGYPVHQRVAFDWQSQEALLQADANTARIFLTDGRAPAVGSLHRQPELGATLRRVAEQGRDGFYRGPVAEDMVACLQGQGGVHSLEDFAAHRGEFVEPISTEYRGHRIYECPPNGQGIVALEMLNILAGFDLTALEPLSVERLHLEIEAARLAYASRNALLADPAAADVPVADWLSEPRAARQRARIRRDGVLDPALPALEPAHADTVYLTVVDKDRNMVSFINSLFESFGSGLTAPKSGVLLQNRGCGFTLEAGHPNELAPGKRPLHTIIPAMLCRDGKAVMPFGVMGGHYQAVGHARVVTNLLDYGMDPQAAIDMPRVFPKPGGPVEMEGSVPADVVAGLQALGHERVAPTKAIGGGQAIRIDWDSGVLTGGSDPRKDGLALGY